MSFFKKLKEGLFKTRNNISAKIESVINSFTRIDEEFFETLEEILISGDIGIETSQKLCDDLRQEVKTHGVTDPFEIRELLKNIMIESLTDENELLISSKPSIILVLGVNGVGKTTTIGKLAYRLKNDGKKVL